MFWLWCLMLTAIEKVQGNRPIMRVANGIQIADHDYPYVVAIVMKLDNKLRERLGVSWIQMCTGSLLAGEWVLTAAHCDKGEAIRYGNMEVAGDDPAATYSRIVERFPFHRDWVYSADIALIKVNEVTIDDFGKTSAMDYSTLVGYPVSYLGYGLPAMAQHLTKKQVLVERAKNLKKQMGESVVVKCPTRKSIVRYGPYICLGAKCKHKRQNPVSGDSGGPLIHAGKIVGVASRGPRLKIYGTSLFTPVSPYLDWINTLVKPKSGNCLQQAQGMKRPP